MTKRFLFATSNAEAAEEHLLALSKRLSAEGHIVGVLGNYTPEQLPKAMVMTRISEAVDFAPDITIPFDGRAAQALEPVKLSGKQINDNVLSHTLNQSWSFGLSLMAKAGCLTVPYHILANDNDYLQLQAKMASTPNSQWIRFVDTPTATIPDANGNLAVQMDEGEVVHLCYLISGKNLIQPAFSYWTMAGLLRKGGLRDYRGVLLFPIWSSKVEYFGQKVAAAANAMGASGLVFLDLLVPKDNPGQCKVLRLSLTPPQGFLAAFTAPGFFQRNLGLTLVSLAKGAKCRADSHPAGAWANLITLPRPWVKTALGEDFLEFASSSCVGYYHGTSSEVPDELWKAYPEAEVKLEIEPLKTYAEQQLKLYHLQDDVVQAYQVEEEQDAERTDNPEPSPIDAGSIGGTELGADFEFGPTSDLGSEPLGDYLEPTEPVGNPFDLAPSSD